MPQTYTKHTEKKAVYELVVRHFLACCSKDAVGQETVVEIDIAGEAFRTTGVCVVYDCVLCVLMCGAGDRGASGAAMQAACLHVHAQVTTVKCTTINSIQCVKRNRSDGDRAQLAGRVPLPELGRQRQPAAARGGADVCAHGAAAERGETESVLLILCKLYIYISFPTESELWAHSARVTSTQLLLNATQGNTQPPSRLLERDLINAMERHMTKCSPNSNKHTGQHAAAGAAVGA